MIDKVTKIKEIVRKCKKSPEYFIDNFCKIKHPQAGILPFKLFNYQRKCLGHFTKNRFNIFGKTRQSGISTLCGAYALWLAMFFKAKTILIVSKRDLDAKDFMIKNVKFVYERLPQWMKAVWVPETDNEHQIGFHNGSKITSLPSGPETLRANSSSLNIIDEAAFCPNMNAMWSGGAPTLQHGGSVLVISTSNGIGNWYWKTWTDAKEHYNEFNPIEIDWWDMDWAIEYVDDVTKTPTRIAPTDGLRRCETKEEKTKYGDYWSPWLETQYRSLTEKGDDSKFRQEVLRDFLGSGNTVLSRETLLIIRAQAKEAGKTYKTVNHVDYIQPITNESYVLEFDNRLWVWQEPQKEHIYTVGADISGGESNDWSAAEVFDVISGEQVAELQIKAKPKDFAIMIDYIGRWYNNAFLVPERTGMGITVCQDLEDMAYPNIFRKNMLPTAANKALANQFSGPIGYNTTGVGKPIINKALIDNLGEGGYKVKSHRLIIQAETYIHLGPNRTGAEKGSMNDDLMIASGLAFVGINMSICAENSAMVPFSSLKASMNFGAPDPNIDVAKTTDYRAMFPMGVGKGQTIQETQEQEIQRFAQSLMVPVTDSQLPSVVVKKRIFPPQR